MGDHHHHNHHGHPCDHDHDHDHDHEHEADAHPTEASGSSSAGPKQAINLEHLIELMNARAALQDGGGKKSNKEPKQEYKFWSTQPVTQLDDTEVESLAVGKPVEPDVDVDQIQKEPYALLAQFEWEEMDLKNEAKLDEMYRLLNENYVEDDEAHFRFDYSKDFFRWALFPPGWRRDWHVGVRVKASGKLVAFISAIPVTLHIREHAQRLPEINFLCVHKKLRSKRLAPVLIKEITRRVNLTGCFQAVYTAGNYLPTPVTENRYYHRSLNTKKLVEVGFSRLPSKMPMARMIRANALPEKPITAGLRKMEAKDIPQACALVNKNNEDYDLKIGWSEDEFTHWHLTRDRVVYSYVVENPDTKKITDFVSFYIIPSTIIGNDKYKNLDAAYMWNYAVAGDVAKSVKKDNATPEEEDKYEKQMEEHEKVVTTRRVQIIKDALILANNLEIDVFNCLNMRENGTFCSELRFNMGDGVLHYYLYNWKCRPILPEKNCLVML